MTDFLEKTFKRTSHLSRGNTVTGEYVSYPETDSPTERKRTLCEGGIGMRTGDIINARFPASTRYGATKVKILYRYYTINLTYKNYHARVVLLDGDNKGKEVSIRIS